MIPAHYLPSFLCRLLIKHEKVIRPYNFHQANGGWQAVLKCGITGKEYLMVLKPIESSVTVEQPLTADDVIFKGGFSA